jgi:hypothetical protein
VFGAVLPNIIMDERAMIPIHVVRENSAASMEFIPEHSLIPFVQIRRAHAWRAASCEEVNPKIERYLHADSIDELYSCALERMERLCGRVATCELLTLLWASRGGLTQQEVIEITHRRERSVANAVITIAHHLLWHDETMSLSGSLRDVVERRYLASAEARRAVHVMIAKHFANGPLVRRRVEELPWQLHAAGAWEALASTLMEPAFAIALHDLGLRNELFRYWSAIQRRDDVAAGYEPRLEASSRTDRESLGAATIYQLLGEFYRDCGDDEKGERLLRRSLVIGMAIRGQHAAILHS